MNSTTAATPQSNWRTGLNSWLRRDGWVMLLYLAATLLMTYPIALRLGGNWIAFHDADTYMKLWDQWWLARTLQASLPLNFTAELFYPNGLDLTFHSIAWSVALMIWSLTPILGSIGAYNFSILVAVFTTAYGGYLLIRSITHHRAAAWLGGAIYSFIPYHIAHTGAHPDLVHLATIPLAVLLCMRAVSRSSIRSAIGAALMLGLAAWTSLYIMVFAFITLGPILIYLALDQQRWRSSGFWKIIVVLGLVSAVTVGARILPIFQAPAALSEAIEQKYSADTLQTDALAFIIPSHFNPIFAPYVDRIAKHFIMNLHWPAYLGVIPLGLCLSALFWKKRRRITVVWSALGLIFILLSLGPVLRLYGHVYSDVKLPAAYLQWLPPIRAVRPDFFVLGLALPLAVCAAIGLERWLIALSRRARAQKILVIVLSGLLLFEYWNGPFPGLSASVSPFYTQLANGSDPFAVIDLPMGRQESKEYSYLQTIHQHPIIEGLSARTPPAAYEYIKSNPLLDHWRSETALDCAELSGDEIKQSLDQLAADNFRYVIVHHTDGTVPDTFSGYLTSAPVYHDATITAYSISDLQAKLPCEGQ